MAAVQERSTVHTAPQGAATRYLSQLKPILVQATHARSVWVRFLNDVALRQDLAGATAEATQVALGQSRILGELRTELSRLSIPDGYDEMHGAIDGWLRSLQISCHIVVKIVGTLNPEILTQVRDALHNAALDADRFNAERAAIAAVLAETMAPSVRPRVVASKSEMRTLGIFFGGLVIVALALAYVFGFLTGKPLIDLNPSPTPVPTATRLPPGLERQIFTIDQIQQRLIAEINSRGVAFEQPGVRLVPPDGIVVSGRIQGPLGFIPVEAQLQVQLKDGKIALSNRGIRAIGISVPAEAQAALEKRAAEGNLEIARQLAPGESIQRVIVEPGQIVAEILVQR